MRIDVDLNRCDGYGQCCYEAPDDFRLIGEEILFFNRRPKSADVGSVKLAAMVCPVGAITIIEEQ